MKKGRYTLYIFIPLVMALLYLLGWNCFKMYAFEQKHIADKVEYAIKDATDTIQNYNGSHLSNYARMITDKDFGEKIAFAAGFTHNKSKISVSFPDADTVKRPAPEELRTNGKDTILDVSRKFLKVNKITYQPQHELGIKVFDSLFRKGLKKNSVVVPFKITLVKRYDTVSNDTIVSSPFIFDFGNPKVYCVRYTIPTGLVVSNILPYLASTVLLCTFLVLGFAFYYRNNRLQQQMSQFREALLGNITHELKTPVTSLQLIVESARSNLQSSASVAIPAEHVAYAENELKRIKMLIDKILSFSTMNREQFEFNKELVNLDEVIQEAIASLQYNITQAGGTVAYDPGGKVSIPGDPVLLPNALCALIDNALKYCDKSPAVVITLSAEQATATITVQDNGIGIDNAYAKKVFEPFFRVPTGSVHNVAGHGLGLSFASEIIKLHGGTIGFHSNGNGTTFYLKFKTI